MSAIVILTRDQHSLKIRQNVDALKARLRSPSFFASTRQRDKVLFYFMNRAVQIGEACFRISDLQMPLVVLSRVLCEDFFIMFWVSQSHKNATAYCKAARSEMVKMVRQNLNNKRARIRKISSGKDITADFLPQLDRHIRQKSRLDRIADKTGLGKLYDIVYRFESLEVHGNTFGLMERKSELDGVAVALSTVNALLRAVLLIADNKNGTVTADDVLSTLNIQHVPGT
jgi:Family of unknown function (DUF5677)